jgi:tRNA(fMet)-specific endonuclease VapC
MYILDTDTLSHLYEGNQNVIQSIQRCADLEICTTIVTKIEMLRGRIDYILKAQANADLLKAQQRFHRTEELLAQIQILSINQSSIGCLVQLLATAKLRKIGRTDLIIASIVLSHRATLVTRNLKHFKQVPGLIVTNWVD